MGLRFKLTGALLLLGLVPLAVTTAVLSHLNLERLRLSTKEHRLATAGVVVSEVRGLVRRSHAELATVGAALSDRALTIEQRFRVARAGLLGGSHVKAVAIYDRTGAHMDTLRVQSSDLAAARPASLSEALRGVARTEGFVQLKVKRTDKRVVVPVITAMYQGKDRNLFGYLWTTVDLSPLDAVVRSTSQNRFSKEVDRVFIIDDAFHVIAHAMAGRRYQDVRGKGIAAGI